MAHILHLDSSPRGERSHSRTFSHDFMTAWQAAHPGDTVTYRDLGHAPVPHVSEAWVGGSFLPSEAQTPEMQAAIQISDDLITEFLAADRYVFGVPMYNLNIPSTLKAYIDQIVRVGKTFGVGEQGYQPLVHGKKMLVLSSRGGPIPVNSPYDFEEPYLRAIFGFMGVVDMTFIHAINVNGGDAARIEALAHAEAAIKATVASW